MENNNILIEEQIRRIKELAGYDKSKTLLEQTAADINMDRINREQLATAPVTTIKNDAWIDLVYSKLPNSYQYKKTTFSNLPALQYDGNPNSTIIYTQNRWFQYPKGKTSGVPAVKGSWKMEGNTINAVPDAQYNKEPDTTQTATTQTTTQKSGAITDKTVTDSLTFEYTYPGDKNYVYAKKDNVWYAKNKTNNKVFNITQNYPSTAQNLDKGAVKGTAQPTTSATTTTTATTAQSDVSGEAPEQPVQGAPQVNLATPTAANLSYVGKKITDMNNIELGMFKKNTPLMFDTAYKQLGAIQKKQIDDKLAGRAR